MARLTIELDDEVVLSNVTVPLTASGIGAGIDAFRALFAVVDPPVDVVLRRDVTSSNSDVTVDLADAPPDWVPFADGHSGDWTNGTCLRVPKALETFPERSWRRARASAWVRMRESDQAAYIAAQKALLASVSGDAARQAASSLVARVGAGVPQSVAAVWEHFNEGTATQRVAELAFSMSGSLLGGLAPRGKVDESSVTAQIHVDMTSDAQFDIVTIGLQGHLFNVFNGTESYTFEVHCRDATGQTVASWDVLQRPAMEFGRSPAIPSVSP